ncbi:MAG: biopolymer transporter ExbD [Candidatus Omnitrophota bacterium]|nr:biopolymer transporter ExbD [Candidatus Omnitrophota bacterium]
MRIPLPVAKKRPRIEIIPLIDIIFFLLATFVMVSLSMVRNQGISVHLPAAATSTAQEPKAPAVTLTVTDQGDVYLDKESVTFEAMSARLKQMKAQDPDIKVFINGDEKAYFGKAIAVLDEVRRLGIAKVSIRTKAAASSRGI